MCDDLKIIRKKYGENMSKICRDLFPSLLEKPGVLSSLILNNFEHNHLLYDDIIKNNLLSEFSNYINSLVMQQKKLKKTTDAPPEELFLRAGYYLYECRTETDIQKFKKYYAKGEELCTFKGNRLNNNYVFFAVKKNVDDIKREDFKFPRRQDEYGVSVISVQFTKDKYNTLSIKNRYNHTVDCPDATFSNNLDNIYEGLTSSFEKYYGISQKFYKNKINIPGYIQANDGKYYKYNYEINNIYYCPNNIIIDNYNVYKFPKEKFLLIDYFIVDINNKKISVYDDTITDSFIDTLQNINMIEIIKQNKIKYVNIKIENNTATIVIDELDRIVEYKNNFIERINKHFLLYNNTMKKIELLETKTIDDNFLVSNSCLKSLELTSATKIGDSFLSKNLELTEIILPLVRVIGSSFCKVNNKIIRIDMPNLKILGDDFFSSNNSVKFLNLPKVVCIGNYFLYRNDKLKILILKKLEILGNHSLELNNSLMYVYFPKVEEIGSNFLFENKKRLNIYVLSNCNIGNNFLYSNCNYHLKTSNKETETKKQLVLSNNSKKA